MCHRLREQARTHWVGDDLQIFGHCKSLWEQSLLAMAVDQLASALDVPPSSRASSLPQWDRTRTGRARSAIRPPREQALLPQI
nr:hypothetical protein C1892_31795 [Pseudomonas sp. MPBD7-1]